MFMSGFQPGNAITDGTRINDQDIIYRVVSVGENTYKLKGYHDELFDIHKNTVHLKHQLVGHLNAAPANKVPATPTKHAENAENASGEKRRKSRGRKSRGKKSRGRKSRGKKSRGRK